MRTLEAPLSLELAAHLTCGPSLSPLASPLPCDSSVSMSSGLTSVPWLHVRITGELLNHVLAQALDCLI